MNRKEFSNFDEVQAFVDTMVAENKWAIDIRQNTKTGEYLVCWIEHKTYDTHDGQTFRDEVWTSETGVMTCVQDLDPEHAKNILRMLLRNEREQRAILQSALQAIAESVGDEDVLSDTVVSENTHTLH